MIEGPRLRQAPRVLCSVRDGSVLFYARDRRTVTVFSRPAKRIWDAFRVPATAREALEGSVHPVAAERCVARMVERGILTAAAGGALVEEVARRPAGKVADIYLHLTNRCNLRCVYCYNEAHRRDAAGGELTTAEWLGVLEQLPAAGAEVVIFTGGEPLLRRDCLDLARVCRQLGLSATLLTNGTFLTAAVAKTFDDVIVSLDSCVAREQEQVRPGGRFERIAEGIRRLVDEGQCRVKIRPVITRYNVTSLAAFPAFAASTLGCKDFMPALYTPGGLDTDLLPDPEVYRESMERFRAALAQVGGRSTMDREEMAESRAGCGAGVSLLSIAANGDVFPCQCLHVPAMSAGNVRRQRLAAIWETAARRDPAKPFDACSQCWAGGLCHLRCPALYHEFATREEQFTDRLCPFSLLDLEDSLWAQAAGSPGRQPRPAACEGAGSQSALVSRVQRRRRADGARFSQT